MTPRNVPAARLADPRYRPRIVRSKKTYTRKGKATGKDRPSRETGVDGMESACNKHPSNDVT